MSEGSGLIPVEEVDLADGDLAILELQTMLDDVNVADVQQPEVKQLLEIAPDPMTHRLLSEKRRESLGIDRIWIEPFRPCHVGATDERGRVDRPTQIADGLGDHDSAVRCEVGNAAVLGELHLSVTHP